MRKTTVLIILASACASLNLATVLTINYLVDKDKSVMTALCDWSRDGDTNSDRSLCSHIESATGQTYICQTDTRCELR